MNDYRTEFVVEGRHDEDSRPILRWRRAAITPEDDVAALELALAKWWVIYKHIERYCQHVDDNGAATCALCRRRMYMPGCGSCPIHLSTREGCRNTPYERYDDWYEYEDANPSTACQIAMDEYDYLLGVAENAYPDHDWVDWRDHTAEDCDT